MHNGWRILALSAMLSTASFGQTSTFAVASVKASPHTAGKDARGKIITGPDRRTAHNVSLKDLIVAAYGLKRYQVMGGPRWLDSDEFDVEAKADGPATKERLTLMLQTLLVERFHIALHKDAKEVRAYALLVDKQGPKIQPSKDPRPAALDWPNFHGDMEEFAGLLSVQLSIPTLSDPSQPGMAADTPVPVVDQTGLAGLYDIRIDIKPEPGADMFLLWQRILHEQLGLKLESQKTKVEFVVLDHADRSPGAN